MLIGKRNHIISDISSIDNDNIYITTETGIELSLSADEVNMISYAFDRKHRQEDIISYLTENNYNLEYIKEHEKDLFDEIVDSYCDLRDANEGADPCMSWTECLDTVFKEYSSRLSIYKN